LIVAPPDTTPNPFPSYAASYTYAF